MRRCRFHSLLHGRLTQCSPAGCPFLWFHHIVSDIIEWPMIYSHRGLLGKAFYDLLSRVLLIYGIVHFSRSRSALVYTQMIIFSLTTQATEVLCRNGFFGNRFSQYSALWRWYKKLVIFSRCHRALASKQLNASQSHLTIIRAREILQV